MQMNEDKSTWSSILFLYILLLCSFLITLADQHKSRSLQRQIDWNESNIYSMEQNHKALLQEIERDNQGSNR